MTQINAELPDRVMRRILWIAEATNSNTDDGIGERVLGWSVMFSGVRCILQYAILPFVLPFVGISMAVATPLLVVITCVAIVSILFSLRRFWAINYRHRWQYLGMAVVALVILFALLLQDLHLIQL